MPNTSKPPLRYVRAKPSRVTARYSFESIQALRADAQSNGLDFGDADDIAINEQRALARRRQKVASFVGRTTRKTWEKSNRDPSKTPGQRRWKDRVVVALGEENEPVAYWRTALNVSSGFERERRKEGRTGIITTIGGMVERGIKRAFQAKSHTFIWTPEYGAKPGYEHAIPVAGALALAAYRRERPGTIYPVTEDHRAKEEELPAFGYQHGSGEPFPVSDLFGEGTTTMGERWVFQSSRRAQHAMLETAGLTELPSVERL